MKKEFAFIPPVFWGVAAGFNLLAAVRAQAPATTFLFVAMAVVCLIAAYKSNKYALQSYRRVQEAQEELAVLHAVLKERRETNEHIKEIMKKE